MTREEAIKIVRNIYQTDTEKEALATLIPELAESEDEEIRKEIISALKFANDVGVYDKHIAYLERQKEQKPAEWIEDSVKFEEGFKTGRELGFREGVESVKPAEWSEEDELMRTVIIQTLERFAGRGTTGMQIEWLKSLCPQPHWKPSEDERIRKALIQYLKDYPVNLPNGLYSRYDFFTYLEKQKEHTLSTEETELNSIAFLEQLGYTCIPPSEQKPNIKSKSLAELREKVMDFFDSAELTEEVKIKDVTDGKCLFVYIDEDDGPVIGIGQRILRGMCDDIKQLI